MRDISAGRDIINSTITEVVGARPTMEILQQPAEDLAAAEKLSRTIVRSGRRRRAVRAALASVVALASIAVAGLLGYFWLLRRGEIAVPDLVRDSSNIAISALVSVVVSALVGVTAAGYAYEQRNPTEAEAINLARLKTIATRWNELKFMGFPKSEMRTLRKRS